MDVRAMDLEPGSFDCVLDKGTFDSVLVIKQYLINIYLSVEKVQQLMPKKPYRKYIKYYLQKEFIFVFLMVKNNTEKYFLKK